jgi:microcystin-dependent protein
MSDPFLGEIRIFAGNFAPVNWALCNGQVLPIQQYSALFSILGVTYGGNGQTTFGLPDFQGRAPIHQGQGPGLTPRVVGDANGSSVVTVGSNEMPAHTHQAKAVAAPDTLTDPTGHAWAAVGRSGQAIYATTVPDTQMSFQALAQAGGGQPHNNMQPYLGLNFIIALQGIFPPRS